MKKVLLILFLVSGLLIINKAETLAKSDSTNTSIGLMAGYQAGQIDFLIPIWADKQIQFIPGIGVIKMSDFNSEYRLSLSAKYFFNRNIVAPFIELGAGAFITSPNKGDSYTDMVFGAGFGGEYFVTHNFSLGIELQLNYTKSSDNSIRFANPGGTNINTATMVYAVIYF